jgi:hypothetical protein
LISSPSPTFSYLYTQQGVDLFSKSYIFIPIHEALHWSLAVICQPGMLDDTEPIILHIDSVEGGGSNSQQGAYACSHDDLRVLVRIVKTTSGC